MKETFKKIKNKMMPAVIGIQGAMLTLPMTVHAGGALSSNTEANGTSIAKTIASLLATKVFPLVGVFFILSGVFRLVMAYRSDNPEGQSGAARDIVVGAVFVAFLMLWSPIEKVLFG